ncbi:MAG: ribosome assembly factor SBDS [Methanomicrobiales archaeon]|nr:ribosome assembly factor SBDS [Methanomicrobiales archaeon]
MIPLDRAVIARLESHGERFEILVDPDLAHKIRRGEKVEIEEAVAAIHIFENAARGERSPDDALTKVFHTTDFETIARRIIEKGEIHLTAEQRRQLIADRRQQVINFIARHALNPQTGLPHPPARIGVAMDEAKVNIDPFHSLDDLVKETMKAIRPLIPIRFEEVRIAVKIPADYAPRTFGELQTTWTVEKDEWQKDGSWICVVRLPGGMQDQLFADINRLTKGTGEIRLLGRGT